VAELIGSVVSVNVGEPRDVQWAGRTVSTAIWKAPVAGRVAARDPNLLGDGQADLRVHGGSDKAVYAYASEDYRWWESELGVELPYATFGENLTTEGIDLTNVVVGQIWRVGSARLRVTQPRLPCFKLGIRMNDASFVDRFERAGRPGTYLRIESSGDIGAGDQVTAESPPPHGLTVSSIVRTYREPGSKQLHQLIDIDDVPEVWRAWAQRQLRRGERRGT